MNKKILVSIKLKLVLMIVSVSVIPLVFLSYINIKTLKNEVKVSIHKGHELAASRISQTIVEMVKTTQESMQAVALTNPELFKPDNGVNREDIIYRMFKRYEHLEEMSMISKNGLELAKISKRHVISLDELNDISNEDKFKVLEKGSLYIGEPKMDADKQVVFELGVPIGGGDEYLSGAITAKISLRQIMNKINSTKGEEGSYIFLIDENGALIGHSDYNQVMRGQDVTKSEGVKKLLENKKEFKSGIKDINFDSKVYESYSGQKVLGVYGLIPIVNWGIVVEHPLDKVYMTIRQMIAKILVTLLLTLIFTGMAVVCLINIFMKSINEIEKGVNSVKSGNFDYKIPKQSNDEIGAIIDAFNNMTDEIKRKKENEKLIISAEKRAAIGTLAAGVAHEINNPMNNLGFYTSDLLERLETEDINELYEGKTIQNYLEIMKEQIERCSSITHNLLKISRESAVNIKPVNIYATIKDILKLMEHRIKKQNISVKIDLHAPRPVVMSDESQIQQMLLNIITNALDAMEKKGTLRISIENFHNDDTLLIKVRDTGYGIKDEDKDKIFDPFYTTKPVGKGTGLGLSISQVIIERMRGTIEIHSEENIGTVIYIKLPVAKEVD
ncbi:MULTISPECIES: sensor histidine kinase [unclassified Sedimentibacter]|uniref:sensor histidine kinase n=1 Tax=unclassified Sedimentibacter TaxID=2649220 RepID=UPI0027E17B93|nr:sensor histidine kinase [Sedimentibacter sp. MB35-C1]WMJ78267.1 sensor histidine kinase [Sedimentibacter sp. MB35-C1]